MRWSLKLGTVAGLGVHVHVTVALVLAWITVAPVIAGHELATGLVAGLALAAALVVTLAVREVSRVLISRQLGVEAADVTLLPLGAIAQRGRLPADPSTEWLTALAGPAANLVLAAVLGGSLIALGAPLAPGQSPIVGTGFLAQLMWANLLLAAIHFLPGLPFDGGRLLRAFVGERDPGRAARLALSVGQGLGLAFAFAGLFVSPALVFVGLLVLLGCAEEPSVVREATAPKPGTPVSEVMITDYRSLSPDQPLEVAVDHIRAGLDQDFPVTSGGRLVGLLTRNDLLIGFANLGRQAAVGDVMVKTFRTVEANEPLASALERFQASCRTLPVVEDGRLLGLLSLDDAAGLVTRTKKTPRPASPVEGAPRLDLLRQGAASD